MSVGVKNVVKQHYHSRVIHTHWYSFLPIPFRYMLNTPIWRVLVGKTGTNKSNSDDVGLEAECDHKITTNCVKCLISSQADHVLMLLKLPRQWRSTERTRVKKSGQFGVEQSRPNRACRDLLKLRSLRSWGNNDCSLLPCEIFSQQCTNTVASANILLWVYECYPLWVCVVFLI